MSQTDCLRKAVQVIANDSAIAKEDAARIIEGLEETIARYRGDAEVQLQRALLRMQDTARETLVAKVRFLADEVKTGEMRAWLDELGVREAVLGLRDAVEASGEYRATTRASAVAQITSQERELMGKLEPVWAFVSESKFGNAYNNAPNTLAFMQERRGIDSGNPEAKRVAKLFEDTLKPYFERANKAGVFVQQMDNFDIQNHHIGRINEDIDGWTTYLREFLDPGKHPDPEATVEAIIPKIFGKNETQVNTAKISAARELFFRSPEAGLEYQLRYGQPDYAMSLFSNVRSIVNNTVLAENFGPSYVRNVTDLSKTLNQRLTRELAAKQAEVNKAKAAAKAAEGAEKAAAKQRVKTLQREHKDLAKLGGGTFFNIPETEAPALIVRGLAGEFTNPQNQTLADVSAGLRNFARFSVLGKTVVSMLGEDSKNLMFAARFHADGFGNGMKRTLEQFAKTVGDTEARKFAEDLGLFQNVLMLAQSYKLNGAFDAVAAGAEGAVNTTAGRWREWTARRAANTQYLSGAQALENSYRSSFGLMANKRMSELVQQEWPYAKLPEKYRKMLAANGITEGDWKRLTRVATHREGSQGTLGIEVNALPADLYTKVLAQIHREADLAIVYPTHYDRLVLSFGTKPGTFAGEVARNTSLFWSWPLAMWNNTYARERRNGLPGALAFAATSTALAAFTMQAYELLSGRPAFSWEDPNFWAKAVARSGVLSPIGDVAIQQLLNDSPGTSVAIESPSFQMVGLGVDVWKSGMDVLDGDTDKAAGRVARSLQRTVVPNIWWLEYGVTHRVMESAMRTLDPQYMADRDRRFRREGRDPD